MSKSREQVVFELAALMRESYAEVIVAAHAAGLRGDSQSDVLAALVPAAEPMVETFMRRVRAYP